MSFHFFSGSTIAPTKESKEATQKRRVVELAEKGGCKSCPRDKDKSLQSPKMEPTGSDNPIWYCLGEAPGQTEDEEGEQFVGDAGQFLRPHIPKACKSKVRWNNVANCAAEGNRTPDIEISCCRGRVESDIAKTRPKVVIGYGRIPLTWLGLSGSMEQWRGRLVPVSIAGHDCWFYCCYHPSFILRIRNEKKKGIGKELERTFARDLEHIFSVGEKLPWPVVEKEYAKGLQLLVTPDVKKLESMLEEAAEWEECGVDIETNALRPYFANRKILTMSVSNYERTFAFPLQHREIKWGDGGKRAEAAVKRFLLKSGRKWAHNAKFELEWFLSKYGMEVLFDTEWGDTLSQAYVLDERLGLRDLGSITRFTAGFDVKSLSSVDPRMLEEYPLPDALTYNAYDAKYCYLASVVQGVRLEKEGLLELSLDHMDRNVCLAVAQARGLSVDQDRVKELDKCFTDIEKELDQQIQKEPDVVRYGKETGKSLNPNSPATVLAFFRHLGFKISGTDKNILCEVDHPVAKLVLEYKEGAKAHSTYNKNYLVGGKYMHEDGKIHCEFNPCVTVTRRLSSSEPNNQNWPARNQYRVCRSIVVPEKDHVIVAIDYGQIEARIIGMASQDEYLVDATWRGDDIHKDWTVELAAAAPYLLEDMEDDDDKKKFKALRSVVKNKWTFPAFYGSAMFNIAQHIGIDPEVLEPLFDKFWDRHKGVKAWHKEVLRFYEKNGYIESLTGWRRRAPLGYNDIINNPIQTTASDIVVNAMQRLSRSAYNLKKPQLQPRLNIHDDLTFYLPIKSLEEDINFIARKMTIVPFDFVNVPLSIEVSATEGGWDSKEEIAVFDSTQFGFKRGSNMASLFNRENRRSA